MKRKIFVDIVGIILAFAIGMFVARAATIRTAEPLNGGEPIQISFNGQIHSYN